MINIITINKLTPHDCSKTVHIYKINTYLFLTKQHRYYSQKKKCTKKLILLP